MNSREELMTREDDVKGRWRNWTTSQWGQNERNDIVKVVKGLV